MPNVKSFDATNILLREMLLPNVPKYAPSDEIIPVSHGVAPPIEIEEPPVPTFSNKYDTMTFSEAFAQARRDKKKVFNWRGPRYTTDLADTTPKKPAPTTPPPATPPVPVKKMTQPMSSSTFDSIIASQTPQQPDQPVTKRRSSLTRPVSVEPEFYEEVSTSQPAKAFKEEKKKVRGMVSVYDPEEFPLLPDEPVMNEPIPVDTTQKPVVDSAQDILDRLTSPDTVKATKQEEALISDAQSRFEFKEKHYETPNYGNPAFSTDKSLKIKPRFAVLHHTVGDLESTIKRFQNRKDSASAQVVIGTDGTRHKFGNEDDIMWHAGESEFKGWEDINPFSIGIELEGNSLEGDFTDEQYRSVIEYLTPVIVKNRIAFEDIVSHKIITSSTTKKPDLADAIYEKFKNMIKTEIYDKYGLKYDPVDVKGIADRYGSEGQPVAESIFQVPQTGVDEKNYIPLSRNYIDMDRQYQKF